MKTVGLYFGSFNPIHIGHVAIGNYFVEFANLSEVWFVPSPQNPLKEFEGLAKVDNRVDMVRLAVENSHPGFKVCTDELTLPTPSYTHQTLIHLTEKYPQVRFKLIIGGDSLKSFHKWKNFEDIPRLADLLVYPRNAYELEEISFPFPIQIVEAPAIDISSTQIRQWLLNHHDIRMFMPKGVYEYIQLNNLYK